MLSIVIPTYNRPELVVKAINSVLDQTLTDLEVIVIDGSDNDDTEIKVSSLSDDRIKYFKVKNQSAAYSRNIGIKMAKGEFVAFNDDDDEWNPEKAEKQLYLFAVDKSVRIVYSIFSKKIRGTVRITPDNSITSKDGNIYNDLLLRNFVGLPTIIVHRSCSQGVMFDESLRCLEDWDWIIRLSKKYSFYFIEESLVTVNNTPQSVNKSDYSVKAWAYKRIYKKYNSEIIKTPRINAKHLLSIGNNLCLSGDIKTGRKYLLESLRIEAKSMFAIASLLLSYSGIKSYRYVFKLYERLTCREP